jgi:hypothetical protein
LQRSSQSLRLCSSRAGPRGRRPCRECLDIRWFCRHRVLVRLERSHRRRLPQSRHDLAPE